MIICRTVAFDSVDARSLLRAYVTELVDRWHGRTMPAELVDRTMAEFAHERPPAFVVAYRLPDDPVVADRPTAAGEPVGCVGLRVLEPSIGEVKRLYVAPAVRRRGVATLLLDALEAQAVSWGMTDLRLDTRHDLVEARALYARHGYAEIPAYNDGPYAQHWFAKQLPARRADG